MKVNTGALAILAAALLAPAAPARAAEDEASPGLVDRALDTLRALGVSVGDEPPEFLQPDEAFVLSVRPDGPDRVVARWDIADHYYLYRKRFGFNLPEGAARLGEPGFPAGTLKHDEYFGEMEVYYGSVEAVLPVSRDGAGAAAVDLEVRYQGCAEAGLCYPPMSKTVSVALPARP